jgi:hypothetical protein
MLEVGRLTPSAQAADLELLRRFEPVVRFTRGEEFLPTDVDWYLCESSLWVYHPDGRRELLAPQGTVTPAVLAALPPAAPRAVHYLVFCDPLNLADLSAFLLQEGVAKFRDRTRRFRTSIGRLARVGYTSRLIDALFSLSLFLRGRVSGDTAAAAALVTRQRPDSGRHTYYGRVVRSGDWTALQYWFFYPYNNWRSGFHGANDHEADWEMIAVYVYQDGDGTLRPAWVAYASHDFHGDDLRRAWDDPDLERLGEHPVVYAGAGSHASYFQPGEYLGEFEVPYLAPLSRAVEHLRRFWVETLHQGGPSAQAALFRVPFVDYARGDGERIGPGETRQWEPVLLQPPPAWLSQYRGLWGLYARDPASGENAPAGPMYNRDGSVRAAWYDPVGWAGLHKVPTPPGELVTVDRRTADLQARQANATAEIAARDAEAQALGVELAALRGRPYLAARQAEVLRRLDLLRAEANALRAERAEDEAVLEALAARRAQLTTTGGALRAAERRAHLHRWARPADPAGIRLGAWLEVWGAISISLLLLYLVGLVVGARQHLWPGLLALAATVLVVEAIFHRYLTKLVTRVTITLAVLSALVLIYTFFWQIVLVAILAAGLYLLWDNVSELRG